MAKRGGARAGAGPKRLDPSMKRKPILITLPPYIIDWFKANDIKASMAIEKALVEFYQIENPMGNAI